MTTDIQTQRSPAVPRDGAAPRVQNEAVAIARRPRLVLPALLSGGLLFLCYFPVARGVLAWVALIPLLTLVRAAAPAWRVHGAAYLSGAVFFVLALQWMRVADDRMIVTWIALALYCACYFPLAIGILRLLDRRTILPLVVSVPVVWTALEYLRGFLMTGFPWYFLGHTQHDYLAVVQISDLGGAYAVTFLVAAVNALIFEWLCRWSRFTRAMRLPFEEKWRPLVVQTMASILLLAGALYYGTWRLSQTDFAEGPRVALIQSNLDQRIRNTATANPGEGDANHMLHHNSKLTDAACAREPRPDLIVWSETSHPLPWVNAANGVAEADLPSYLAAEIAGTQKEAGAVARRWKTNVLLGVGARVLSAQEPATTYNSAVLIERDGRQQARYDKMHRVPFGEYVPLVESLPWMNQFAPYDYEYSVQPGKDFTRFHVNGFHFGVIICYEDTDPTLARQYVKEDHQTYRPRADFLVNISNDGWFDGSSEHEQHLAICRFRAIECRRSVARAVNMGISAVIDGNGRVCLPPPEANWADYKKSPGFLVTAIPIDRRESLYASWGDWLPLLCWLLLAFGVFLALVRPRAATV